MLDLDYRDWGFGVYCLYSLAVVYLACFFGYYALFHSARQRALLRGGADVARYNRLIKGFPNGAYAKMLGHKPL